MKRFSRISFKAVVFTLVFFSVFAGSELHAQSAKARKYFEQGYEAFQYGEFEEAEKLYFKAIGKEPHYTDALDALAKLYQVRGVDSKAIFYYRKVLEIDNRHPFALYELGELYFGKEMLDSAKFFFNSFLSVAGGGDDKFTRHAKKRIENVHFAQRAMASPEDVQPQSLGLNINTQFEEYSPALTIDGNTMYFNHLDASVDFYSQNEDIFVTKKVNGKWQPARSIGPPINTIENEGAFCVSADGKYIFYTACNKQGGKGRCDIWITMNRNGEWSLPQNIGAPINTKYWESQPNLSSDGRRMYFASNRPGGYGGIDLYVSYFSDTGWTEPQNLGPKINTSGDEQFPFIHPDGRTLYFSSDGHPGMGESDLFVAHLRPDNEFDRPINLGYPINSIGEDFNLIVERNGTTAYFSTSKLEDGEGGLDLYTFELPDKYKAQRVNYLQATVIDAVTGKKISARIELSALDGSSKVNLTTINGGFLVPLEAQLRYALHVESKGYLFLSEYFDMPNTDPGIPFEMVIKMQPMLVGNTTVLNNVFFDTDKTVLKDESLVELNKLVEFLNNNPEMRIEIGGHTDDQGSQSYNLDLSERRAKAVMDYLVSQGIEADRLRYKGYGQMAPIVSNATVEGRAKNRRTEFKIIE